MTYNPLTMKRRHILGSIYAQCDPIIDSIPVYLDNASEDPIGTVDEGHGSYADAFVFHLPEDVCKRLSTSGYTIGIDYDFTDANRKTNKDRIKLNYIVLVAKPSLNPIPRKKITTAAEPVQ